VIYAGGPRISEAVNLTWSDVIQREDRVQLSIAGKGGKVRQVLLHEIVSRSLLSLRGDAGANDPVFASRNGGALAERTVNDMVSVRPPERASMCRFHHIGCAMPTARTPSTVARPFRKSTHWVTTISPPRAAICMLGRTARAASSSILGCFFDEGDPDDKQ
jgi:Phage integrase family